MQLTTQTTAYIIIPYILTTQHFSYNSVKHLAPFKIYTNQYLLSMCTKEVFCRPNDYRNLLCSKCITIWEIFYTAVSLMVDIRLNPLVPAVY